MGTVGPGTLLIVTSLDAVQSAVAAPNLFAQRTNNGNRLLLLSTIGTGRAAVTLGNSGTDIAEDPASPALRGATAVVALTFSPGGSTLFVDGVEYGSSISNGGLGSASPAFHGNPIVGGFLRGLFHGGLIINRILTPAEMLECKRYWQ
jgi:hypothetical protein